MAWLGLLELLVFAGVFLGVPAYMGHRRRSAVAYKKRRRVVEAAMHREEYDRQIIDDVAREWGYDARRHYRRPPAA